jgi:4-amino-4-deoxy-L-arabinose transferase-like glycosyltransferase
VKEAGSYRLAVGALLVAMPVLSFSAICTKSATFDEPINLMQGLEWLASGYLTAPVDYGPLPRLMAAASVRLSAVPLSYAPATLPWAPSIRPRLAQQALYLDNDADRLLFWGRAAFLPLQLLLAVTVFSWSRRCWGPGGGLVSLVLCAFHPSLLAHGSLITSDFPVTAFLFTSFSCLELGLRRATWLRFAACGLLLGLALMSKVSALAAIPVVVAVLCARVISRQPWRTTVVRGEAEGASRSRRGLLALLAFCIVLAVAETVIWGFYGFRYGSFTDADPLRGEKAKMIAELRVETLLESAPRERFLEVAERLRALPEPYLLGMRYTFKHMERRLSYFLGRRSFTGSVWYFPVAFLLKAPLGFLLLLAWVAYDLLRRRLVLGATRALALLLFPAFFLLEAVSSHIDLGERYILPVYPFLLVLAGGAASFIRAPSLARKTLAWGALLWALGSSLAIYPHYLAYFNELAGGPRGGMRYLGDSNLDWGQDLRGVRPWMEKHGVRHIKLGYFGTALPQYYGLSFEWLPSVGFLNDQPGTRVVHEGDTLAVSATCLQGFYFADMHTYRFLDAFEPVDHLGYSIYLYRIGREHLKKNPGDR